MNDRTRRVLMVEDDDSLRAIVSRHLQAQRYAVHEAASAEDAVRTLENGLRPDVVVLDLSLPGASGWDLLRGRTFTVAGSPPVIVTTATTVSPKELAEFGCAGYLRKPFPLDALVETLERVLGPDDRADA
jgi:DNA-binding response OmpR family regulator